eukprot:5169169-Prymnesium_polylepis.1
MRNGNPQQIKEAYNKLPDSFKEADEGRGAQEQLRQNGVKLCGLETEIIWGMRHPNGVSVAVGPVLRARSG